MSKKRIFAVIAILALLVIIPITVLVGQKQQDIRQRASGEEATVFFGEIGNNNITPLTELNLSPNQEKVLGIFIDTGNIPITGFDITVSLANVLQNATINSAGFGTDSEKFEKEISKETNLTNGIIHLEKVTDNTSQTIKGKLHIGSVAFTVKPNTNGNGIIGVTRAEITSYGRNDPLTVDMSKTLAYTISSAPNPTDTPTPTSTPIPPTPIPTTPPTITTTPTPFPVLSGLVATCIDNKIDLSWDPIAGASRYLLRLNDRGNDETTNLVTPEDWVKGPTDVYNDALPTTVGSDGKVHYRKETSVGTNYTWWIHASKTPPGSDTSDPNIQSSYAVGLVFTCPSLE